ncbi:sensor histidine kinase [Pedobacter sandarakinus]|uniref:sensor histidine kinase n=1 Tax=Pedobacter sandarakinus TaxID=353156 RepID=UPI0022472558|nr:HAMP domain-containing sensor histidine kinase [Pedobacter sandarakinus]MCX2574631.1 HAMP domain-containing sensor histidine kinase [Pedobacter sandarakinus]
MRLFTKYNWILVLISAFGLLVIGFLFYRMLVFYLDKQIDHDMVEEIMEVKEYSNSAGFYSPHESEDLVVQYKPIAKARPLSVYADTVYYNPVKHRQETARYLKAELDLVGKPYQVLVIASKTERQQQIKDICLIILIPVSLLFALVLLLNRILLKKIWTPFEQLLKNITAFNINHEQPYQPVDMPVAEFKQLNSVLVDLASKVKADYAEIKLFTENASHEMMTPLAVINSKLDNMLQSKVLGKEDGETLIELYKATSRLTKLNQSLLLLVKIDHNLLQNQEEINLTAAIADKANYFQELISERNLKLDLDLSDVTILASQQLLEILINNLFSNVIRHNYDFGKVEIKLTQTQLIFANTGHNKALDPDKIFERFYKDATSEGTGLGLAILKQICNRQNYLLDYHYHLDLHTFTITFKNI